ncbi:MAG: type II secretion system major pseudopilin GspG [Proteobacteria bacterium]|nr:type II secretion system major pseudopilin GspG [Pseudomonadota bacterium]
MNHLCSSSHNSHLFYKLKTGFFHKPSKLSPFRQDGMTLLEIIIVVALLGSLMVYLVSNLTGVSDSAKVDQAGLAMGQIGQSLNLYRIHNNRYPTNEQGLSALITNPGIDTWRHPYIDSQDKLKDPWGNPFNYESSGREYRITSNGVDGIPGNEDDISYPKNQQPAGDGN